MDVWVKNYMAACKDVQINYKPDRLRRAASPQFIAGHDRLRRLRLRAEARGGHRVQEGLQGRPGHQPADGRRPDRRRLQRPRRRRPRPGRPHPRQDLRRKIKKWNDPAIKKLNPDADAAQHRDPGLPPLRRVRHHARTSASTWARPPRTTGSTRPEVLAGQGRPVRVRLLRCRRAGQADRRRHRLLRALLRHGQRHPDASRSTPAPASPVEATSENASKAIADAKVVGTGKDLALELDYAHQGRGRLPDHPGDVRDRLRQGQQGRDPRRHQVLPDLHRQRGRPEASSPTPATPRCPKRSSTKVRDDRSPALELTRACGRPRRPPGRPHRPVHRRQEHPRPADPVHRQPGEPHGHTHSDRRHHGPTPVHRAGTAGPRRDHRTRRPRRPGDQDLPRPLPRLRHPAAGDHGRRSPCSSPTAPSIAISAGRGQLPHHLRVEPGTATRRSSASRSSPSARSSARSSRWSSPSRSPSASPCSSRTTRRAGSAAPLAYVIDLLAAVPSHRLRPLGRPRPRPVPGRPQPLARRVLRLDRTSSR